MSAKIQSVQRKQELIFWIMRSTRITLFSACPLDAGPLPAPPPPPLLLPELGIHLLVGVNAACNKHTDTDTDKDTNAD